MRILVATISQVNCLHGTKFYDRVGRLFPRVVYVLTFLLDTPIWWHFGQCRSGRLVIIDTSMPCTALCLAGRPYGMPDFVTC